MRTFRLLWPPQHTPVYVRSTSTHQTNMHSQENKCASVHTRAGKGISGTHMKDTVLLCTGMWYSHRGAWYMWPWGHGLSNDELEANPLREGRHSPAAHHPVGYREAQVFVCPALQVWQVYGVLQGAHLPQHHHRHQLAVVLNGHPHKAYAAHASLLCLKLCTQSHSTH